MDFQTDFLCRISRSATGIISRAKSIRRVLSESVSDTILPRAAPAIPAAAAKGTIFHSIRRFFECITVENSATGRKNRRFIPWAADCETSANNVSQIIRIKPPPSPIEAAIPVRKPIRIFILSSS